MVWERGDDDGFGKEHKAREVASYGTEAERATKKLNAAALATAARRRVPGPSPPQPADQHVVVG
jgi:hypothetical protein